MKPFEFLISTSVHQNSRVNNDLKNNNEYPSNFLIKTLAYYNSEVKNDSIYNNNDTSEFLILALGHQKSIRVINTLQKKQVIQLDEKSSLFLFLGGLISVVVFASLSKSVYTGSTIFHFKPFFRFSNLLVIKNYSVSLESYFFRFYKKNTFST